MNPKAIFAAAVSLALMFSSGAAANAATPVKSYMEIKDERHVYTKIFEALPDEDPFSLRESPFEQDGFSYAYYDTTAEEIKAVEKKAVAQTASVSTANSDVKTILQQFAPDMDYSDDEGFAGKLYLDHASVTTEAEGYVNKKFTLNDSVTVVGLGSNDPAAIPKTKVKDGVTLTLQNIDWSSQSAAAIDFTSVPATYTAVAHYSGAYSKKLPTGFVSAVEYKGEVSKVWTEKVIYTLTYIGTRLPEPTPVPTPMPEPAPAFSIKLGKVKWLIVGIAVCLAAIALVGGVFFYFYYNTYIYIKAADEYVLTAKRRLKLSSPVVDLAGLDVCGKEVAVNVKSQQAKKLFGRYIKTVADGEFTLRTLVDKRNCDFWYTVEIPAADA